jgi:addiction module HigA family antidote
MSKSRITTKKTPVQVNLPPIHPGQHLRDELDELGLSINALARALDVPTNRITAILNGKRSITTDTAYRLSCFFGTSAELWLNLQQSFDLAVLRRDQAEKIAKAVMDLALPCRPVASQPVAVGRHCQTNANRSAQPRNR